MPLRLAPRLVLALVFLSTPRFSALSQQAPSESPPASGPKLSGYIQGRETYQEDVGLAGSINRARVTVAGGVATHFTWRVQGEFRTGNVGTGRASVSLQDAYIRYAQRGRGIQVGQFKTPFTREFITSLADVETADRSSVVDSLAPKRDIGIMGDYAVGRRATVAVGVFNGDGQNTTGSRDSSAMGVARATVSLTNDLSVGLNGVRYFGDSTRYGVDAAYESPIVTAKAEYLGQARDVGGNDDWGWYGLGAVRVVREVQLVGKYEEFDRPGVAGAPKMTAWTLGGNVFLAGPAVRLTANYVSRRVGSQDSGILITQLQVRF